MTFHDNVDVDEIARAYARQPEKLSSRELLELVLRSLLIFSPWENIGLSMLSLSMADRAGQSDSAQSHS
jgi:hypothetical protein